MVLRSKAFARATSLGPMGRRAIAQGSLGRINWA
jgi:hypothetical protein